MDSVEREKPRVKTKALVEAVAATAVMLGLGVAPSAGAAGNVQVVGIEGNR